MTIDEIRMAYYAEIDTAFGPIPAWREFRRDHIKILLDEIDRLRAAMVVTMTRPVDNVMQGV